MSGDRSTPSGTPALESDLAVLGDDAGGAEPAVGRPGPGAPGVPGAEPAGGKGEPAPGPPGRRRDD